MTERTPDRDRGRRREPLRDAAALLQVVHDRALDAGDHQLAGRIIVVLADVRQRLQRLEGGDDR